ncbi:MAG: DNA mismatch repair endonuclease MutL [Myxococcota bacterium]
MTARGEAQAGKGGQRRRTGARPRIERLPSTLIDQIAAGEVVERPSSVVKELVENALDAGAGRIRVEVREGGNRSLAVADDGCGMTPDEARLAFERHATSKLRSGDELAEIRSYGFRGEALPAIASVSKLRLLTRARGSETGFELHVDAGRLVSAREAAATEGTRIEVGELFAAVPARRKFLKSPQTEWGHVSEWLGKVALASPGVHFDVRRDDRAAVSWPAVDDPLERIATVLGEGEAAALVHAARDAGDLALDLFVSRPDRHRATGAGLHLFVNGRPVRDRVLRHALLEVHRDLLPRGRFPTALLFLRVAPGGVDVNVHPAKWEVRFADSRAVHALVTATTRDAVAARRWLSTGAPAAPADAPARFHEPGRVEEPTTAGDWLFARRPPEAPATEAAASEAGAVLAPEAGAAARPVRFGELRVLGQLLGTYLLLEAKEGLLLVDQHAAHERVLYEGLRAAWLASGVPRQPLLLPETLELEEAAIAALVENAELIASLGYEVEPFGERALLVRAVPALIAERDPLGALRGLADQARSAGEGTPAAHGTRLLDPADRHFASLACHSARRAGEVLPAGEQQALVDALDAIPWAPTCPHGRPVAVPISATEIARRFGRT